MPPHALAAPEFSAAEVEERKRLFGIRPEDAARLAGCRAGVEARVDGVVEAFYTFQLAEPLMRALIEDPDTLSRLRAASRAYILELFSGVYDQAYAARRLRIGLVHKRIGVPPKLYLAAFSHLHGLIEGVLEAMAGEGGWNREWSLRRDALRRVLMFDMEIVFHTYVESLMGAVESARSEIQQYAAELERSVAELSELSRRDPLTSLLNHRAFIEELKREIARAEREGRALSLAYIDLNGFKEVNDARGHQAGDRILRAVARLLVENTRASDIACRYGGDEFAVILPQCTTAQARQVCEKVMAEIHEHSLDGVSLSIGVAESAPGFRLNMDDLITAADTAMYRAKDLSRRTPGSHLLLAPPPEL